MIVIDQVASQPIAVRIPGAVRMTGLSRSRLYELMKSGELDYVKVGSSTLIIVASLSELIERHRANKHDSKR